MSTKHIIINGDSRKMGKLGDFEQVKIKSLFFILLSLSAARVNNFRLIGFPTSAFRTNIVY
jgi:hypothetical protein